MHSRVRSLLAALATALVTLSADAIPPPGPPSPSQWPALSDAASDGPRRFITEHTGTFGGHKLKYRASVVETILKDPEGKPAASGFTTAFTLAGVKDPTTRPVIFLYNGGPGGGSSLLMFGAFGPKRMTYLTSAALADPKIPVVDNPYTVLDSADLVFIDPPDTGFSRRLEGVPPRLFLSIDGDSFVVGQTILHWLASNGRLSSPVYLAGESYGTLRCVALARDFLKAQVKINLRGLIMISQAITYNGPASISPNRPLDPFRAVVRLPDVAAAAWYHGKIDNKKQTVEEAVNAAKRFARTDYATALLEGNRLAEPRRQQIAIQLAEVTGIPAQYYLTHNLRIREYRRELLKDEGRALAQFDGRETEPLAGLPEDADRDWDAAMAGLDAIMGHYAETELKVKGLGKYVSVVHDPYGYEEGWTYVVPPAPTLDIVLTDDMKQNPNLRLLVPQGIFDTTSSMGSTTSMFEQLDIPSDRVVMTFYAGGHMVYSDLEGLKKFMADVRLFVTGGRPSSAFPSVSGPTTEAHHAEESQSRIIATR
jgi:carboxypeptidase C (cathepsin A)